MKDINTQMREIIQYQRMAEDAMAIVESLKDELKKYMEENHLDTLKGDEHKATYKPFTSSRVDAVALKNELPDVAARYMVTVNTMRFTLS